MYELYCINTHCYYVERIPDEDLLSFSNVKTLVWYLFVCMIQKRYVALFKNTKLYIKVIYLKHTWKSCLLHNVILRKLLGFYYLIKLVLLIQPFQICFL